FCWKDDLSMLQRSADERELFTISAKNWCGGLGARLGWWLVDSSLGFFGIVLPMILMLLGARIIRRRPLLLNHSVLLLSLVMIFGSLTLGFAFGENWSLCCSSGWGGAFGIGMANLLRGAIGPIGLAILLLVCWILIGVFINRDFIDTVNSAVDRSSGRIARIAQRFRHRAGEEDFSEPVPARTPLRPAASWAPETPEPAAPVRPQPAPSYGGEPWTSRPQEPAYPVEAPRPVPPRSSAAAQPVRRTVAPPPVEEEDPFEEITRVVPGAEPPAPEPPTGPVIVAQDDEFIEFDLSNKSKGRVVMGRGGLVELDRPVAPAKPQPVVDGPFEEITMAPQTPPAPAPQPTEPEMLEEPADPDEPYLMSVPARPAEPVQTASPVHSAQPVPPAQPTPAAPAPQPAEEGVVVTVETHEARLVDEHAISTEAYDPLKDLVNYRKPPVTLLEDYVSDSEVS
ncbi:MAG: DNA translocase FtsK 4TM domain-containing protein, partial [Alistipes sp.]|nr:DNA translocase FtsK 4TM domain-containing protein [Alistipes sp.]